tara:strand:+ start:2370 stop:2966 length:597 start_codon:yes stop_codon:yes gene_type:complete
VKHINIPKNPMGNYIKNPNRYKFIDGEWWYYYPEDGTSIASSGGRLRERAETLRKRIDSNMIVNGKYIPKSHPLHKPGKYKGFMDAAFSSLNNYETNLDGQVYIIANPSYPEWIKVGMAVDAEDRLKQYQTSSPYRDYILHKKYSVKDRREAETNSHVLLDKHFERRGEWFKCSPLQAEELLNNILIKESNDQLELAI